MNEIGIYNKISELLNKKKSNTRYTWILGSFWVLYTIVMLVLPLLEWAKYVTIFIPLIGWVVLLTIVVKQEYKLANKYPIIYNDTYDPFFVQKIQDRVAERAQPNRNHIKIINHGLKYLDDNYDAYKDDKQKFSNAIYNAVQNSSLVQEIIFFEKYKKFIDDMNQYRSSISMNW